MRRRKISSIIPEPLDLAHETRPCDGEVGYRVGGGNVSSTLTRTAEAIWGENGKTYANSRGSFYLMSEVTSPSGVDSRVACKPRIRQRSIKCALESLHCATVHLLERSWDTMLPFGLRDGEV